ncbi:hypothetical protein QYM36_013268 [Artemia franciscana]|nr:hypothetical protein QYM36_013268 [Artemia franciscana]
MGEYSRNPETSTAPLAEGSGSDFSRNRVVDSGASSDSDTSDFRDFQTTRDQIQIVPVENPRTPIIDLSSFNPEDYPVEDYEERARQERAREMAEGVDPPPGFRPGTSSTDLSVRIQAEIHLNNLTTLFHNSLTMGLPSFDTLTHISTDLRLLAAQHGINVLQNVHSHRTYAHTQIDYIHCLVPDLYEITRCSFYWGKMDRYEAERLLDNKPDGTFLLRDSAQEEYLFSVSFRRYSRSLHARIEQWNHKFSFDSHDPGVFASPTVCGLMEHYKDPSCCMFFEPMLTIPLHRTFVFSLQHMCRAVICSSTTYDGISCLQLPRSLKVYLKEYHYRQRIRVRRLDIE